MFLFPNSYKLAEAGVVAENWNSQKTAKEKSSNLLQMFCEHKLTEEDLATLEKPIQVRLI